MADLMVLSPTVVLPLWQSTEAVFKPFCPVQPSRHDAKVPPYQDDIMCGLNQTQQ
jgi:hypothetical protein